MAKNPVNMTADERLKRIRSLERKVADLERDKEWAEHEQACTERWAQEAWAEVRRLHDVCTQHWTEKQAIRVAAGLEPQPSLIPLAKWNHETREWEPDPQHVLAEQEFLAASVAVWREVDHLEVEGDYPGIDQSTDLRKRERAAWEAYRTHLLAASGAAPYEEEERHGK